MTPMDLLFYPSVIRASEAVKGRRGRFVHYTNADTAMKIIQNAEIWMRKSSCMNDFREVEYGINLLATTYRERVTDLKAILDPIYPQLMERVDILLSGIMPMYQRDTYIASMSEHDDHEDMFGRLSMWRAYGGSSGVAIVVRPDVFLTENDAINAFTSPVAYHDLASFRTAFDEIVGNLRAGRDHLVAAGFEATLRYFMGALRAAILCTKHPGFAEEREWRVIYSPNMSLSPLISTDVMSVGGIPQPISKLPLKDRRDLNFVGAAIPSLIDRIIIGPTQYPAVLHEAFMVLLLRAGVPDPGNRIVLSDIPLRR